MLFSHLFPSYRWNPSVIILRIHSYFDNVMAKFMFNNWTDAWKTDVNLLRAKYFQLKLLNL